MAAVNGILGELLLLTDACQELPYIRFGAVETESKLVVPNLQCGSWPHIIILGYSVDTEHQAMFSLLLSAVLTVGGSAKPLSLRIGHRVGGGCRFW